MRQKISKIILFTFFFLFFSLSAKAGDDRVGLSVSPAIINWELKPKEERRGVIKITNIGRNPLPLTLNFKNISSKPYSLSEWIKIENPFLIINPNETREVKFLLETPPDARSQTYWDYLMIEPRVMSNSPETQVAPVVALPFIAAVKGETSGGGLKIAIEEFSLSSKTRIGLLEEAANKFFQVKNAFAAFSKSNDRTLVAKPNLYNFNIKIKNDGDYHFKLAGRLALYDRKNNLLAETDLVGGTLLPAASKNYELALSGQHKRFDFGGRYRAIFSLENISAGKEISFWYFSLKNFLTTIAAVLTIFFGFWLMFGLRGRLGLAAKALLGKGQAGDLYKISKDKFEIKNIYNIFKRKRKNRHTLLLNRYNKHGRVKMLARNQRSIVPDKERNVFFKKDLFKK